MSVIQKWEKLTFNRKTIAEWGNVEKSEAFPESTVLLNAEKRILSVGPLENLNTWCK